MPIRVKMPDGRIAQFPDGMGQDEIRAAIMKTGAPPPPPMQAAPADTGTPRMAASHEDTRLLKTRGEKAMELAGTALSIPGAVAGAQAGTLVSPLLGPAAPAGPVVGGILGAMGGGFTGELLNQAGLAGGPRGPSGVGDAIGKAGNEAMLQGAMEATGLGAAKAVGKVGEGLYAVAAKTPVPEIVKAGIREGITVGKRGLDRLSNRIRQSSDAALNLVRQAGAAGQRYDGIDLARKMMQDLMPQISVEPTTSRVQKRRLRQMIMSYLGDQPWSITPERLHRMKQKADDIATPIYAAIEKGDVPVSPRQRLEAQANKAFADHAREVMNLTINGYQDQNLRTSQLMRLKDTIWPSEKKAATLTMQAVKAATRPAFGASVGAGLGAAQAGPHNRLQGAAAGALIGGMAGSARLQSAVGVGLNNPWLAVGIRTLPRAFAVADKTSQQ